jgi:hypothetical protein
MWVEIDQCMLASFDEIEELVDGVHSFEELADVFKRRHAEELGAFSLCQNHSHSTLYCIRLIAPFRPPSQRGAVTETNRILSFVSRSPSIRAPLE